MKTEYIRFSVNPEKFREEKIIHGTNLKEMSMSLMEEDGLGMDPKH